MDAEDRLQRDWFAAEGIDTEGPAPELLAGDHTVVAAASCADGRQNCFDAQFLTRAG